MRIDAAQIWIELKSRLDRFKEGATPEQRYEIAKNTEDIKTLYAITELTPKIICCKRIAVEYAQFSADQDEDGYYTLELSSDNLPRLNLDFKPLVTITGETDTTLLTAAECTAYNLLKLVKFQNQLYYDYCNATLKVKTKPSANYSICILGIAGDEDSTRTTYGAIIPAVTL